MAVLAPVNDRGAKRYASLVIVAAQSAVNPLFSAKYPILNYYRLEAGRFEDFVSYGLKSFAHEGVT